MNEKYAIKQYSPLTPHVRFWTICRGGASGEEAGGVQPPLTSVLENYAKLTTFLVCFATVMLNFLGCVIHRCKDVFKTFPTIHYKPPRSLKFKLTCNRLAIAEHAGQKLQWEINDSSFLQLFLRVHCRKVGHLLTIGDVYWQ
jgi:hypothetical protein